MKNEKMNLLIALVLIISAIPSLTTGLAPTREVEPSDYTTNMNVSRASLTSFLGTNDFQHIGMVSSPYPGDLNGDSFEDILFGDSGNDTAAEDSGSVLIYFGGPELSEPRDNTTPPDASFMGEHEDDSLGSSVSFIGDVNGDGIDDMSMISFSYDGGTFFSRVYLVFGRTDGWGPERSVSEADVYINAEIGGTSLSSVTGMGDVNNDGFGDFMISSMYRSGDGHTYNGKVYLILGHSGSWSRETSIDAISSASYLGECDMQYLANELICAGDVNSDGIDDMLLSASWTRSGTQCQGRVYLIFGKEDGWEKNASISTADVSFDGEVPGDYFGLSLGGGSDVNGDGIDDLIMGTPYYDSVGVQNGRTYLFFGRSEGWTSVVELSDADAVFSGNGSGVRMGESIAITHDINMDGLSDILIGSPLMSYNGRLLGAVFIFHGRSHGFSGEFFPEDADASFVGEYSNENFGGHISTVGDVTGTGGNGILLAAPYNDQGGTSAGKAYLIAGGLNFEPLEIYSVRVFSDSDYSIPAEILDIGETAYIEVIGRDGNTTLRNTAYVNITLKMTRSLPIRVPLRETAIDSGIYRGSYRIAESCTYREIMEVIPVIDSTVITTVVIDTPVRLNDLPDAITMDQDEEFDLKLENLGYFPTPSWKVDSDASWLEFNEEQLALEGIPMNPDVGRYLVDVELTDGKGQTSRKNISITVKNIPPVILTGNLLEVPQGEQYIVDYDSSEDGLGDIRWGYSTNATFLNLYENSGILTGVPTNNDVGWYWVNVWVTDGNGGKTKTSFEIIVHDANDRPWITTTDVTQISQGDMFRLKYEVLDIDPYDSHIWSLFTDADWLTMDPESGLLKGTPGPDDVGLFKVNVTVADSRGMTDWHYFEMVVLNVNDPPFFANVPGDLTIQHGEIFEYDIEAFDHDQGDFVKYSLVTKPLSDMSIDITTGRIYWEASLEWFQKEPFVMKVEVTASDHELSTTHKFQIEITPSSRPTVDLLEPLDGTRLSARGPILKWSGSDEEGDELTYSVYLSETQAFVTAMKDTTLIICDYPGTEIELNDLKFGRVYYWLVIPNDGCSDGDCGSGPLSFTLNSPPEVTPPESEQIVPGERYRILIKATDRDEQDKANLRFELVDGPSGMQVDPNSGLVTWTPRRDQDLMYRVIINVTDSVDTTQVSYILEVLESGEEGSNNLLYAIIGVVAFLLVGIFALFLFMKRRKQIGGQNIGPVPEEQIIGPEEEEVKEVQCDVALTPSEAHAHLGKGSRQVTYEELYGAPQVEAPEEDVSAYDLRESIRQQIHELESIGTEE